MNTASLKVQYTLIGFVLASVTYASLLVLLPELRAQVMELRAGLKVECTDTLDNDADGFVDMLDPSCQVSVGNPESFQVSAGNWTQGLVPPPVPSSQGNWTDGLVPPVTTDSSYSASSSNDQGDGEE